MGSVLNLRPPHLYLGVYCFDSGGKEALVINDINLPTGNFSSELVVTRLDYSFSTNLFLKALIQYNSDFKQVASNIRFNFIHRPLSDFFLIYNEKRSTTGEVAERA